MKLTTSNRGKNWKKQEGVALFMALFAILLVAALAIAMVFMADTETMINYNYRDSQAAYFEARAGLEEARDRIRVSQVNSIPLPTALPGPTVQNGVIYITNPLTTELVEPWKPGTAYFDDELCHEGWPGFPAPDPSGKCTTAPAGTTWYTAVASTVPYTKALGALSYKWVRITLKSNSSAVPYYVNLSNAPATANTQVCYNGANEVLLPGAYTNCYDADLQDVVQLVSRAVTPRGGRRTLMMEVSPAIRIPLLAAVYSKYNSDYGNSINVTGINPPTCLAGANTIGAQSGLGTVTFPGSGNATGAPVATKDLAGYPYNTASLVAKLAAYAKPIDSPGTGIAPGPPVPFGPYKPPAPYPPPAWYPPAPAPPPSPPPNWIPPATTYVPASAPAPGNVTLGIPPVVTRDASGAIIYPIVTPGTPETYLSPASLTLGGTGPVAGHGTLIVNGDLILDISKGFNYQGLIIVTGNLYMWSSGGTVEPHIDGGLLVGGEVSIPISSFGGPITFHQDMCGGLSGVGGLPVLKIGYRESIY